MKIHYATISETGKRRNNEDAFRIVNSENSNHWLAVVCDGMGGHAMGEVASETVSDAIVDYWKKHTDEPDNEKMVKKACAHAMRALDKKANSLNHCQMGTTMVMASIEGDTVTIAHVEVTADAICSVLTRGCSTSRKAMCGWIMVGRLLTVASSPIIMRQMSLISRSSN